LFCREPFAGDVVELETNHFSMILHGSARKASQQEKQVVVKKITNIVLALASIRRNI